jgi:hypothetical protein
LTTTKTPVTFSGKIWKIESVMKNLPAINILIGLILLLVGEMILCCGDKG